MSNKCRTGYCAKGFTGDEVMACQTRMGMRWNGRCAYQNGQPILSDDTEVVELDCCSEGCTMKRGQYAHWNGMCAFIGKSEI
jgi:hypothetical protein